MSVCADAGRNGYQNDLFAVYFLRVRKHGEVAAFMGGNRRSDRRLQTVRAVRLFFGIHVAEIADICLIAAVAEKHAQCAVFQFHDFVFRGSVDFGSGNGCRVFGSVPGSSVVGRIYDTGRFASRLPVIKTDGDIPGFRGDTFARRD